MHYCRQQLQMGFSLVEIMVSIAIIAILASIAIPAYNGYVHTARLAEGSNSIALLHLAQVEFFEENGFFFTGTNTAALIGALPGSNGLWLPTPWDPTLNLANNNLNFIYDVANCVLANGNAGALVNGNPTQCYTVTATGQNMLTAADVLIESN